MEKITDSFTARILMELKRLKRSKAWLASEIGISRQLMNWMLNHSGKPKYLHEMALVLEVDPHWLKTGENMPLANNPRTMGYKIPLLSQAMLNDSASLEAISYLEPAAFVVTEQKQHTRSFACRMDDNHWAPAFQADDVLIFTTTPSPKHGDTLLVKNQDNQLMLGQYHSDDTGESLTTITPSRQRFTLDQITVLGRLTELRRGYERANENE